MSRRAALLFVLLVLLPSPVWANGPAPPEGVVATESARESVILTWSQPDPRVTGYDILRGVDVHSSGYGPELQLIARVGLVERFVDRGAPLTEYVYRIESTAGKLNYGWADVSTFMGDPGAVRTDVDWTQGTRIENDQPNSDIGTSPSGISLRNRPGDDGDEVLVKSLPYALSPAGTFSASASFGNCDSSARGFPIVLKSAEQRNAIPAAGTFYVHVTLSDPDDCLAGDERPTGVTATYAYVDSRGVTRLTGSASGPRHSSSTAYPAFVSLDYNASNRLFKVAIRDGVGVLMNVGSYTIGSQPGDGFIFDEMGAATDGPCCLKFSGLLNSYNWWFSSIDPAPTGASTPPLGVSAAAGLGRVTLTWSPPANEGSAPVTSYRVYRGPQNSLVSTTVEPRFEDTEVEAGASMVYRVSAVNAAGESAQAAGVAVSTPPGASAPRSLSARGGPGRGEVSLSWIAPSSDGGHAITGYRIGRAHGTDPFVTVATVGDVRSWRDQGLPDATSYRYEVRAITAAGLGQPASALGITYRLPGAPTDVQAVPKGVDGTVDVWWTPPTDTGGASLTGFDVYRTPVGGVPVLIARVPASPAATWRNPFHDKVPETGRWSYEVAAVNVVGAGAHSARFSTAGVRAT